LSGARGDRSGATGDHHLEGHHGVFGCGAAGVTDRPGHEGAVRQFDIPQRTGAVEVGTAAQRDDGEEHCRE